MIVLGITNAACALEEKIKAHVHGETALVLSPQDRSTPRDRLAAQLKAHRALPVFLPLAARRAISEGVAISWLKVHGERLRAPLSELWNMTQMTLVARSAPHIDHAQSGASWLAQKAERLRADQTLCDHLVAFAEQQPVWPHRIQRSCGHVTLHLCVSKDAVARQASEWARYLHAEHHATAGWRFALSSGWPPSAFCQLDMDGGVAA